MQSKNEEMKARYTAELEMAAAEVEKSHNKVLELENAKEKTVSSPRPSTTDPGEVAGRARDVG